jgi:transcriptional regulator GlxA family with amidase domain
MNAEQQLKIGIVVFDIVEEQDFVGPYEVLKLALNYGANATVGLYSTTESLELTGSNGLRFHADASLGSDPLDLVIVPGGGWNDRGRGGTWDEVQRGWLTKTLVEMHAQGTIIASVCTGGMVLASAGLLRGRHANTHRIGVAELEALGAKHVDARVVDEGDVLTSAGVVAGLDLGLWLVERFFGKRIRADVEYEIEYERRGPLWSREPASAAYRGGTPALLERYAADAVVEQAATASDEQRVDEER